MINSIINCLKSIPLFARNHPTHTSFGIFHIPFIARYQVQVDMKHRLTSCFIHIDANVVSVWMKTFVHFLFHILKHYIHCFSLMIRQIEVGSYMPFRDY